MIFDCFMDIILVIFVGGVVGELVLVFIVFLMKVVGV